jgi:hypothetical protein
MPIQQLAAGFGGDYCSSDDSFHMDGFLAGVFSRGTGELSEQTPADA